MITCPNCKTEIPAEEEECTYCGHKIDSNEREILKNLENIKQKRKQAFATFLLSMFGMWVLPFRNLALLLALVSLGMALPMSVYYTWQKKQEKKKLENPNGPDYF